MRARSSPLHRAVPRTQVCVPWAWTDAELWKGSPSLCQEIWTTWAQRRETVTPPTIPALAPSGLPNALAKAKFFTAGKRHSSVQPRMMLRHVALLQPTQGFIFYYTLKWTVFFDAFFFSSGKKLIWVEKDLYDSHIYDSCISDFNLCYATTSHTLYFKLYSMQPNQTPLTAPGS